MSFIYESIVVKTAMRTEKRIGIWIDHLLAKIIEFSNKPIEPLVEESEFGTDLKVLSLSISEKKVQNNEQQKVSEYYYKLSDIIDNYDEILLFGPTDAKVELNNILLADKRFTNTKINVEDTGQMSNNQQYAFVREHFAK